jgi:hypothetical protein
VFSLESSNKDSVTYLHPLLVSICSKWNAAFECNSSSNIQGLLLHCLLINLNTSTVM